MPYTDRIESPTGIPGMQGSRRIPGGIATFINASNRLPQINNLAVGTTTPNVDYKVAINDEIITYRSEPTDTATTILKALLERINLQGTGIRAEESGAGIIQLTGYPGEVADILVQGGGAGFAISQQQAASNAAPIGFGLAIARAPGDKENVARLPTSGAYKFQGVTLLSHKEQERNGGAYYRHTDPMPAVQMGSLWVPLESQVTVESQCFVRLSATGNFIKIGGFTPTGGAGTAELVGARWITGGYDCAELFLHGNEYFAD